MKLIINTTNLQSGGALQVALSLLGEWHASALPYEFHVFLSPQIGNMVRKDGFDTRFFFYQFTENPASGILNAFTFRNKLKEFERQIRPDAVLTIFGPALWTPRAPHLEGFANGYYLFDHSDFIKKRIRTNLLNRIQYYARRALLFHQLRKEATHYWVETEEAELALAHTIKKSRNCIDVIGNTYSGSFRNKSAIAFEQNERFTFLYLSAYYAHKNFEIIPSLIEILVEKGIQCTFMLTVPQDIFENLFHTVQHKEYLSNKGPVNPQESYNLYAQCNAVFMPSLLETFSANFPEAMISQKPILASGRSFAINTCGDAALYFDPENALSMADKISQLIADVPLQQTLIQNGNRQLKNMETPASRADKIVHILKQISRNKAK
jgi:glycosyltransferase involved in cell wall biosynthesis